MESTFPHWKVQGRLLRPTEEDAAEEHAELVQLHEKWEKALGERTWRVEIQLSNEKRALGCLV